MALASGFVISFAAFALCDHVIRTRTWRLLFALPAIPALAQGIAAFTVPESPMWLSSDLGTLHRVYRQFANAPPTEAAIASLQPKTTTTKEPPLGRLLWAWRSPFILMVSSTFLTFFTGGFNLRIYAVALFELGTTEGRASFAVLGLGLVKLAVTVIALLNIDTVGRRPLILISLAGMSGCAFMLALIIALSSNNNFPLILVVVLLYTAFFQIGFGVCNFVLAGDVFPAEIKGRLTSALKLTTAIFQSTSQFLFAIALQRSHLVVLLFGAHAAIALLGFLFFHATLVETKHKDPFRIRSDLSQTPFFRRLVSSIYSPDGAAVSSVPSSSDCDDAETKDDSMMIELVEKEIFAADDNKPCRRQKSSEVTLLTTARTNGIV